jgi:hypothetical protein
MFRNVRWSLALVISALLCSSCGQGDHKPLVPVKGRVLFEGKPVPHALVVFHPLADNGSQTVRPRGQVAEDGSFELTSYATHDGAYPGAYRVTVEWWLTRATAKTPEGSNVPPTNRLPARYSKAETSGLSAQITPGVHQLPTLNLNR